MRSLKHQRLAVRAPAYVGHNRLRHTAKKLYSHGRATGLLLMMLSIAADLGACANHQVAECLSGAPSGTTCTKGPERSAYSIRETAHRSDVGQIGLALSGGGSKSAPFEMGVFQGLAESKILDQVDVISSVSGGSYAALYYFSRLYAAYNRLVDPNTTARDALGTSPEFFFDCYPLAEKQVFGTGTPDPWSPSSPQGMCPESEESMGAYWPIEPNSYATDPLREASHIRGFQDVLSGAFVYGNDVRSGVELRKTIGRTAAIVAYNSVLLFAPNFFANSLFDWRVNLSPSKNIYDAGITRTYARDASLLTTTGQAKPNRPAGSSESPARLTFAALRELAEATRPENCTQDLKRAGLCHVPFWIINSTAGTSRSNLRLVDPQRYSGMVNGFEFTPYGYGAGAYGWYNWGQREMEPRLSVPEAVGVSAAFFDSQQHTVGNGFTRPAVNLLLHGSNLDWGTNIPNYNQSRAEFTKRQLVHELLPWPLYMFHHNAADPSSLYIHLSDGGMSENLGVAALIRRKVQDIIIVDAGEDKDYQFNDLCELGNQLNRDYHYSLEVELWGNTTSNSSSHVPWSQERCGHGNNPFGIKDQWPALVIRGRVCNDKVNCNDSNAVARLYILKAALNYDQPLSGGRTLRQLLEDARNRRLDFRECATGDITYPCEVVGYLAANPKADFPQDSTVGVTLNSNAFIYGVYKELGRYYARHLVPATLGVNISR